MRSLILLATWLLAMPSRADDDASFGRSVAAVREDVPLAQTALAVAERREVERYSRLIGSMLSWYGRAETEPGLSASELALLVVGSLRSGDYDALVVGESHSDALEDEATTTLLDAVLDAGIPVGAFLQEATDIWTGEGVKGEPEGIFDATQRLASAQIPLLLMKSQFDPGHDVEGGLKISGPKLLITFSGSAHTGVRVRDYIVKTLKGRDLGWGNVVPGRPVIEQVLKRKRRRPLIIAMIQEGRVLGTIEAAVLSEASKGAPLALWETRLAAAQTAWEQAVATFAPASEVRFRAVPEHTGLYLGISPKDRRPLTLDAARKVARMPELADWLGGRKIKAASVWPVSWVCASHSVCLGYQVVVDRGDKEPFIRQIPVAELP